MIVASTGCNTGVFVPVILTAQRKYSVVSYAIHPCPCSVNDAILNSNVMCAVAVQLCRCVVLNAPFVPGGLYVWNSLWGLHISLTLQIIILFL